MGSFFSKCVSEELGVEDVSPAELKEFRSAKKGKSKTDFDLKNYLASDSPLAAAFSAQVSDEPRIPSPTNISEAERERDEQRRASPSSIINEI